MMNTIVPLGGVSRTLPARYSIDLSMEDTTRPYPLTLSMVAMASTGKVTLSCQIGRQTLGELIKALTEMRDRMEDSL